jgi:hypothetical protein
MLVLRFLATSGDRISPRSPSQGVAEQDIELAAGFGIMAL